MSAKTKGRGFAKSTHLTTQVAISLGMINPENGHLRDSIRYGKTRRDSLFPTPRANKTSGKDRDDFSPSLHNHVLMFPTPTTDNLPNAVLNGAGVETVNGQLNPDWVEWLMGFPVGWTDLEVESPTQYDIAVEPAVPRVTTKKQGRPKRLKQLGNAVVPQVVEQIGRAIMKTKEAR